MRDHGRCRGPAQLDPGNKVAEDPPVIDLLRTVVAAAARFLGPRATVAAENLLPRA